MASKETDQHKITTKEILAKLKADKDHTKFFYLYVSTSEDNTPDEEPKRKKIKLSAGQRTLDNTAISNSGMSQSSSREDNDVVETGQVDNTESTSQPKQIVGDNNAGVQNDQGTTITQRGKAMKTIHDKTIPHLLSPMGWRKVCDKDMKPTYRALYFNTIKKESAEEDEIHHIQRVSEIRKMVEDKANEVMDEYKVKFKINSLLSRPLLYDEDALKEQLISQGSTHQEQQTKLDDYFYTKKS